MANHRTSDSPALSQFILSAIDPAIPYESPSEEEFDLYCQAIVFGLARLADQDSVRSYDLYSDNLGSFIHAAGHERASWGFDNRVGDDNEHYPVELSAIIDDAQDAVFHLTSTHQIEWIVRDGELCTRVPNLANVLSNPIRLNMIGFQTDRIDATMARLRELASMPYAEYLRSPEWLERRERHLEFAGHACQVCNRKESLHVHHRTYAGRGHERTRDLIVLCKDCHQLFHDHGRLKR